ncbi:hypothetical protein BC332_29025 [Capsicum chinense]|nr:hypothetical protein BC332_29025 [Capsicum chinense]
MIDCGTTLEYLAEEAYDIFVNAITKAVSQHVRVFDGLTGQCYRTTSRVDIFPVVSLNFTGGAAMVLRGEDYLIQQFFIGAETVWCMSFQTYNLPITQENFPDLGGTKEHIIYLDVDHW